MPTAPSPSFRAVTPTCTMAPEFRPAWPLSAARQGSRAWSPDLMLGEVEELWDMVAIAEYPSRAAMLQMVQSPKYQAITKHRDAGLAGQLDIRTKSIGN